MIFELSRVTGRKIDHPLAKDETYFMRPYSGIIDYSYTCDLRSIEDLINFVTDFSTYTKPASSSDADGLIINRGEDGRYRIVIYDDYIE